MSLEVAENIELKIQAISPLLSSSLWTTTVFLGPVTARFWCLVWNHPVGELRRVSVSSTSEETGQGRLDEVPKTDPQLSARSELSQASRFFPTAPCCLPLWRKLFPHSTEDCWVLTNLGPGFVGRSRDIKHKAGGFWVNAGLLWQTYLKR